ncbi:hypothetical protein RA280_18850 [Cupriavidus sp. CV2]|uniref:hypothetical protein n=1 Tax=Cupriavidus ulmosensis TaxID=3065913 RepID=UPI00296B2695|nr:hypothetical protein [Cupriavidus sp. CV2]MDW3683767.1 hypothetical protein [Cupriavidus sp. CV2]
MLADVNCRAVAHRLDFVVHRRTIAEQTSRVCLRGQTRVTCRPVREQIDAHEQGCLTFEDTILDKDFSQRII